MAPLPGGIDLQQMWNQPPESRSPAIRWNWGASFELRGEDLNLRPSGYEPDELPDCSTPRHAGI